MVKLYIERRINLSNPKRLLLGAMIGALAAIIIILLFVILSDDSVEEPPAVDETVNEENVEPVEEEEPEPVITKETIELAMIGDVLLHTELAKYDDFSPSFAPVLQFLLKPDFLVANQESLPIASKFGISGYP